MRSFRWLLALVLPLLLRSAASAQVKFSGLVSTTGYVNTIPACPQAGSNGYAAYLALQYCAQGPVLYRWTGYSCNDNLGGPGHGGVCDRLGTNGKNIQIQQDYNGPASLLIGVTTAWNVAAGETLDVVMSGYIGGTNSTLGTVTNGTWPHWCKPSTTGCNNSTLVGYYGNGATEENIVTVGCLPSNCTNTPAYGIAGSSDILCTSAGGVNCTEQSSIGPYSTLQAGFNTATAMNFYTLAIEVKMNGGPGTGSCSGMNFGNWCATLETIGTHLLP
jgi:hypothetical protein